MRIERHKNFLSDAECAVLNAWVVHAIDSGWMDAASNLLKPGYKKRFTSRFYGDRFEYPEIVLDVSKRVRSFCGVSDMPLIEQGHGRDGIVVSCTLPGGDVYAHVDGPRLSEAHSVLRCNIVTQVPDGGAALVVGDKWFVPEQGELHCYLASDHEHLVTQVAGNTNRILWMFGAHVPTEDWNSGKIKVGAT